MNFSFFIARRYFSTQRNSNFVHVISWVSLIGVAIGTAALILVLSVFNGFEDLILKMYNSFDPHIKITASSGKVFSPEGAIINHVEIIDKAYVLEEQALLRYQEKEFIATIKGVSSSYKDLVDFNTLLVDGDYIDSYSNNNVAVIGRGVAYYLSVSIGNMFDQIQIFTPNYSAKTLLNPKTAFQQSSALPVGIFGIQAELDERYMIMPLEFVQNLSNRGEVISAIELKITNSKNMVAVQQELKKQLGDEFLVQNRLEQQEFLYKILNTEKLVVFLILIFIMIIAAFNIVGSLSMLILDKKKDISALKSFGATHHNISAVFFYKSILTIAAGIFIGLFVGLSLAILQQNFGFIKMGSGGFVVDAYPVLIRVRDICVIIIVVLLIGLLASWYPAKSLSRKMFNI